MMDSLEVITVAYLSAVNAVAFVSFWIDKRRSRRQLPRISERTLLAIAFWGGSLGALSGQHILRHKTGKQPFRSWLAAIAVFHILIIGVLVLPLLAK
jgi:uncharacterized membrane protein YsdA (DUF1294 family)